MLTPENVAEIRRKLASELKEVNYDKETINKAIAAIDSLLDNVVFVSEIKAKVDTSTVPKTIQDDVKMKLLKLVIESR